MISYEDENPVFKKAEIVFRDKSNNNSVLDSVVV
jgi:hypothetical protein